MKEGVKRLTRTLIFLFAFFRNGCCEKKNGFIYILQWTPIEPLRYYSEGQDPFISRNCSFQNCFITNSTSYFKNLLDFDVLLLNAAHMSKGMKLPSNRSEHQKYIFVGWDSAAYFPISADFDDFFNLTWTYKLTSDFVLPYMVVKNKYDRVIGPSINMKWIDMKDMAPTKNRIKQELRNKSIAAAWVASNCYAINNRQDFAYDLKNELLIYGLQLDIYGYCGNLDCGKMTNNVNDTVTACSAKIKSDYYFYLAFENSFSEDYVTEKVLHGLNNFAVPVVYGGANYTRFMPNGIYLDARDLGISKVAQEINEIVHNRSRYYEFFKWHEYYSYRDNEKDDYIDTFCGLCALLNRETFGNKSTVLHISQWWNVTDYITDPSDAPDADVDDAHTSSINEVTKERQYDPAMYTQQSITDVIFELFSDVVKLFEWQT